MQRVIPGTNSSAQWAVRYGYSWRAIPRLWPARLVARTDGPTAPATQGADESFARIVSDASQRGVLQNVLQPGIYYLNPRLVKVDVVPSDPDLFQVRSR